MGRSESARINRARLTDLGRRFCGEPIAERLVGLPVPVRRDALLRHIAEVNAVGRGHHAARHGKSLITDVRSSPGPVAALSSGCSGRGARVAALAAAAAGLPTVQPHCGPRRSSAQSAPGPRRAASGCPRTRAWAGSAPVGSIRRNHGRDVARRSNQWCSGAPVVPDPAIRAGSAAWPPRPGAGAASHCPAAASHRAVTQGCPAHDRDGRGRGCAHRFPVWPRRWRYEDRRART